MPSIFRSFIKSRRKRKKGRSTTPVNTNDVAPEHANPEKHPSDQSHDHYTAKKNQPQEITLKPLRTFDDNDVRRQPSQAHNPTRHRSRSFESSLIAPTQSDTNGDTRFVSDSASGHERSTDSHCRVKFFRPLRRKSKRDDSAEFRTKSSSSNHDRKESAREQGHRRQRSRSFDQASQNFRPGENIASKTINTTKIGFHGREQSFNGFKRKSKDDLKHTTIKHSNTSDADCSGGLAPNTYVRKISSHDGRPIERGTDLPDTKLTQLKLRFKPNEPEEIRKPFLSKDRMMGKRSIGNTKTVIMNGQIVVSNSMNSKSSTDTATITSTASSNSKARAMRRESERNARAASALDDKGNDLFEKGYFDKAMACYTKALKLKRRTFAHLLQDSDDVEEELMLRDDNGILADPQALVSMATSINNIGYLRQRSGDATPEETMAAYKKSLRIKRRILGNDSLSVGKTLNNIGSVHYLKRDLDWALSAYDEALEIMKSNLGEKHPDIATVMSNIGDVYLAKDMEDTSIKYYRLALAIRWEAFGEKSPRVIRLLEKISNLEIGDMSFMTSHKTYSAFDDAGSEFMVGSDFQPISEGLKLLQQQIKNDIDQVDQLERNAAVEMLKDKIIIIRGMRDVWNGNASGPELLDNDSASVQTAISRLTSRR